MYKVLGLAMRCEGKFINSQARQRRDRMRNGRHPYSDIELGVIPRPMPQRGRQRPDFRLAPNCRLEDMPDFGLEGFDLGARRGGHDEGRPEPHVVRPFLEVDHGEYDQGAHGLRCHGQGHFGSGAERRLEPVRIRLRGKQPPRRARDVDGEDEQPGREVRRRLGCKTAPHQTPYGLPSTTGAIIDDDIDECEVRLEPVGSTREPVEQRPKLTGGKRSAAEALQHAGDERDEGAGGRHGLRLAGVHAQVWHRWLAIFRARKRSREGEVRPESTAAERPAQHVRDVRQRLTLASPAATTSACAILGTTSITSRG